MDEIRIGLTTAAELFDFGQDMAADTDDEYEEEEEPEYLFTFIPGNDNLDQLASAVNYFHNRLKTENRGELCAILLRAMLSDEEVA